MTRDVSAFPRFDGETGQSAFVVALSPDEEKRWLYLADKWMDVDSRGAVCMGETSTGRRVQKFVPRETDW